MREIKRNITTTKEEIFYEISKQELEDIKSKERIKGREDIAGYINYCYSQLSYKTISISALFDVLKQIIEFARRKEDYIENGNHYNFSDYIKEHRE